MSSAFDLYGRVTPCQPYESLRAAALRIKPGGKLVLSHAGGYATPTVRCQQLTVTRFAASSTHGQLSAAQGSSTTVSRSDIQLT
jgi:hypothetical protein